MKKIIHVDLRGYHMKKLGKIELKTKVIEETVIKVKNAIRTIFRRLKRGMSIV